MPEETEERILQRAAGIPLYAVETVRMLLDRGLLVQDGSMYRPTGPIETLEVPETLHALIAARLDGLTADERRAVQDAAVLGTTFFASGLASVTGQSEKSLSPVLASLVRKEVLSVQADPRSPEHGQYGFLQDLLRTVAYETLSRRERRTKHLAAATFLEGSAAEEEVAEVLAAHYLQAYEAAPDVDDSTTIKARARELLTKAGEHAASLAAADEALRYFEQAIALTDEPLALAELHEKAGRMARLAGEIVGAKEHFERAIETFDGIDLSHPAARVSAALAEILWQEGHIEEAVERMRTAFDVLASEERDADLATLAAQLGRVLFFMGHPDQALERIELALDIAEGLRLPDVMSDALNTRGLILGVRGRVEEGTLLLRHSLQVALDHGLSAAALRAYNNLAARASQQDRYEDVLELGRRGLQLARRVGDRLWESMFLIGDLGDEMYLGRWDEALEREALVPMDTELPQSVRLLFLTLIPIFVWRGDLDAARRRLALFPDGGSSGDVQNRAVYQVAAAMVSRAEGRLREALEAAQAAFASRTVSGIGAPQVKEGLVEALEADFALEDLGALEEILRQVEVLRPGETTPYIQAQSARFAGKAAILRGDHEAVEPGFRSAEDRFTELSMPFHLAVARLEHAEWLASRGRGEDALPLLVEARDTFEGLRAVPWLQRLDRVPAGAKTAAPS